MQIRVLRSFDHADGIYPSRFEPGVYTVVDTGPGSGEVSRRCAEVALAEGWASEILSAPQQPADQKPRRGRHSPGKR